MRLFILIFALCFFRAGPGFADVAAWKQEWPKTDFSVMAVDSGEIVSGGPSRDEIPVIDTPRFSDLIAGTLQLAPTEPVVSLEINGDARAYPLRILTWHEIVNDTVGGMPVVVTYGPLCNAAIVFKREIDGEITSFGTTGKLRKSDMIMYDRLTESWWQQFQGIAIAGKLTGEKLQRLPARLESFERFGKGHPEGKVLMPPDPPVRDYGRNPYIGYDTARAPFLYRGNLPEDVPPMTYVVAVEDEAWTLGLLRKNNGVIENENLRITWAPGMNSALDSDLIASGRDIGNVLVEEKTSGGYTRAPYDLTFAFVFYAFHPEGVLHY